MKKQWKYQSVMHFVHNQTFFFSFSANRKSLIQTLLNKKRKIFHKTLIHKMLTNPYLY